MKSNQAKTRSEIQEHIDGLSDRIQRLEEKNAANTVKILVLEDEVSRLKNQSTQK